MSLLSVKLRRDLWATWPRLVMMVGAIAISLTVFGGVLFAWSAIGRETQGEYLGTEPASATIQFGPGVDDRRMAAISAAARQQPGVIEATGRTQFASEIEVNGQVRAIPLQVFVAAPNDPMRMATFEVESGDWPPAVGEILVRRDSLSLLDVSVGDTVTVRTPGGLRATLRIAGTVYDPSLAPAPQQQTGQAYLSTATLAALGEPDVLDQLKIQVVAAGSTEPSQDRDAIVAAATGVGAWLGVEYGLAVREIQVPTPYAHPHQGQADALLSALLAGAGAALLLAAILVANMLHGLFTQQIPQIGIMKAIGARSARIARHYLVMTLLVAGAATLVALPAAFAIGRALAPMVFGFLGIQPASVGPAGWTYAVVLAAGLVLPPAMALVPLVKAARTTVRAAIDRHGGTDDPRLAAAVLTWLGRLPQVDRGLLMVARNTLRRPARFFLSVGLLASAGMMFVAGMSARDGTQAVADDASARLRWDVGVQLASPVSIEEVAPVLARVDGISRIEGWTMTSAGVSGPGDLPVTRTYPDQGHGGTFVTAYPADTAMLVRPPLREGRWLDPGETGAIVLSQVTMVNTGLGARPGDTVHLWIGGEATSWRVAGIVEERADGGGAYVTAEGLARAMGQPLRANNLRIATEQHDEATRGAVAAAVDEALAGAGIDVRSADSIARHEAATGGHLAPILVILLATALPMGLIGCIGLASTMSANVLERTREFGVMHAIGARPRAVRRIVVAEGILVAIMSCLVAALPALGLTAALGGLLGDLFFNAPLPFRVSVLAAVIWAALVVLGAMLATEAAASRASRLTVREALAYL